MKLTQEVIDQIIFLDKKRRDNQAKLDQHLATSNKMAKEIGSLFKSGEINKAKDELIKKMKYQDCYVRPFAWRGSNLMGLSTKSSNVHVSIAVWDDWTTYYNFEDMKDEYI